MEFQLIACLYELHIEEIYLQFITHEWLPVDSTYDILVGYTDQWQDFIKREARVIQRGCMITV